MDDLDARAIQLIRGFAMDAPRRASSGHPGTAMALAPAAHVLYSRIMRHDPADPHWPDRDRFVLSCGHASILLYSMLYLSGYGLELDDLEAFRQWGSHTPGHPEANHGTTGVEVTTGPLGQGVGNSVGMAIAERYLRARFGSDVMDHHTFVLASDGDLMEGLSHEAASLAGHLGLGHLCVVFDDNHITIDGDTDLAVSDDYVKRFEAYGWHTEYLGEVANDCDALEAAFRRAMAVEDRPVHAGAPQPHRLPVAGVHGQPEGPRRSLPGGGDPPDEGDPRHPARRAVLRPGRRRRAPTATWWPSGAPRPVRPGSSASTVGRATGSEWHACWSGTPLPGWEAKLPTFEDGDKLATRQAIQKAINATLEFLPGLLSGAGDLTGNTGVKLDGVEQQERATPGGRQIHYGIREHAMGSAMNGMAMHGGILPVGGTFFVFSDYLAADAAAGVAVQGQRRLRVHPRLGRAGRGRTHPSADRAPRLDPGHPRPPGHPAGRRQRDGPGVAHRRRAPWPHRAGPDATGRPGVHRRLGRGGGCRRDPRRRPAPARADRHRQ